VSDGGNMVRLRSFKGEIEYVVETNVSKHISRI